MQTIQLDCVDPAHASRSAEADWTAHSGAVLTLPDGVSPTPQQLSAGGLCRACARLGAKPVADAVLIQAALSYLFNTHEDKVGGGALSLKTFFHRLTTTAANQALTLGDGIRIGQLKTIRAVAGYDADHGSVLTPAHANGFSTISWPAATTTIGAWIVLRWQAEGWTVLWHGGGVNGAGPTVA